jgi:hypothetical protein
MRAPGCSKAAYAHSEPCRSIRNARIRPDTLATTRNNPKQHRAFQLAETHSLARQASQPSISLIDPISVAGDSAWSS